MVLGGGQEDRWEDGAGSTRRISDPGRGMNGNGEAGGGWGLNPGCVLWVE